MFTRTSLACVFLLLLNVCSPDNPACADKPRVFVLTDIENEPDDAMSMVRFLVYANQYDIEGLAATTSIHQRNRIAPDRIRSIVEAYGQVRDNLETHEAGFPTQQYLIWFCYCEAGTFPVSSATNGVPIPIMKSDQTEAAFVVPDNRVMPPGTGTIHVILAVTDHGQPRLTRYQRVIVDVSKAPGQ